MSDIYQKLEHLRNWQPSENWQKITTLDAHTAGEPLRVILSGYPELKGDNILDYRRDAAKYHDHLRKILMWEPRGHADMYGAIITPPVSADADFGVLFIHNEGYSTMCGHAIIALTKVFLQTGLKEIQSPVTPVIIDAPAGRIEAFARIENHRVERVFFRNVPSFIHTLGGSVEISGNRKINYDIAFGGAFYTFVNADDCGISMAEDNVNELIQTGMEIKRTVMQKETLHHPTEADLNFLYGTIFYGKPHSENAHSRNVCIFAEGEVDRSPTGTGVSARMALHYFKNEMKRTGEMIIESIIGSRFHCKIYDETKFGNYDAVIPQIEGNAYITGKNEFYIDPEDPLKDGFILR